MMGLNEKLGLKAFGPDALGEGKHINKPDDFYIRAVTNLATSEGGVPDADKRELGIFSKARKHLDKSVFDEERWKNLAGRKNWPKTVYLLNRGGRYEEHAKSFKGKQLAHPFRGMLQLYQEKTASLKYSATGENYPGIAKYVPVTNYAQEDISKLSDGYEFSLITHRTINQTKSRTVSSYWLLSLLPENGIIINPDDAKKLQLEKDDQVKVISATNTRGVWDLKNGKNKEMVGKIVPSETMRPGVISFVLGFGHWAYGAVDVEINGETIKGDSRRAQGVHANAAMWTDSSLRNNTCMIDPVGGSVSFYDTKVKLEKV